MSEQKNVTTAKKPLISKGLFRAFVRLNMKGVEISDKEIDVVNEHFSNYLKDNLTQEQIENILPKSEMDVIMNLLNPLTVSGFPPGLVLHFTEFVEKEMQEAEKSE